MPDNLQMARQGTSFYDADSGQNQSYTITLTDATGGTFTATVGGQTTSPAVAYNAPASTLQTRLAALSTVGAGNVTVSGNAGGPYTVTFVEDLARTPVVLTVSGTSLTGAGAAIAIAEATAGINGLDLAWGFDFSDPDESVREIVALPAAARSARVLAEIAAGNIVETATAVTTKPAAPWGTNTAKMSRRLIAPPENGDTLTYNAATGLWDPQVGN